MFWSLGSIYWYLAEITWLARTVRTVGIVRYSELVVLLVSSPDLLALPEFWGFSTAGGAMWAPCGALPMFDFYLTIASWAALIFMVA